jgi:uncharacterized membrane protein YfcA
MIELWHLPLLFATAFAAGFVDSIAGRRLDHPARADELRVAAPGALGTNKLQATFGSGSAAWQLRGGGTVELAATAPGGSSCRWPAPRRGALAVQQMDPAFLRRVIPLLLIGVAVYFLVRPQLGETDRHYPACLAGSSIGSLAWASASTTAFSGRARGRSGTMAFVLGLGFNLTRATGYTKFMNFASNLSSLALFLAGGKVLFVARCLTMGVGQLLGARVGARMVIRKGTRFIRPIFVSVVLL